MSNFYDHNVMMAVQKAHQLEALEAAHRHRLVQQAKTHRPRLWERILGFRPAINIQLRANATHECTLNPAAC
jgi:hypothetical protein